MPFATLSHHGGLVSHLGTTMYARSRRSCVATHLVPGRGVGILVVPARSMVRASRMVPIGRCSAMAAGRGERGGLWGVASRCALRRLGGIPLARWGASAADADELLDVGGGRGLGAMAKSGKAGSVVSIGSACGAAVGPSAVVY